MYNTYVLRDVYESEKRSWNNDSLSHFRTTADNGFVLNLAISNHKPLWITIIMIWIDSIGRSVNAHVSQLRVDPLVRFNLFAAVWK